MNILQITAYYPPSVGGIQFYVQRLSQQLVQQGHNVDVLTINTDQNIPLERTDDGVNVRRCEMDFGLYRAVISREFNHQLKNAIYYDVYHIHIPFHIGLEMAVLAAKYNGIPLIATHHGQGLSGGLAYKVMAQTYSWFCHTVSLQGVDCPIFLTPSYADSLHLPKSIESRKRIVRTGADIAGFSPQEDGSWVRQFYNIQESAPLILFVGSLHKANRYKGVDVLIRSFPLVRRTLKNARLMIAGGGELLGELRALAQDVGLQDQIVFTDMVDNAQLPAYYAAADLLALPSIRGPENSPVVVFEAMASGKPVVASAIPGVCEIVKHGESGLLVPPQDVEKLAEALIEMLADKKLYQKASKQARLLAESYSWAHCAGEMGRIYEEVVQS